MNYVLKSMSLTEILDTSTRLLQNRFKTLMTISAYAMIPLQLASNLTFLALVPAKQPGPDASMQEVMDFLTACIPAFAVQTAAGFLLLVAVLPITSAAIIHAVSSEYLGQPASASACMRIGFQRFGALIGAGLLKTLIVSVTSLFFLIPGVYFWYKYTFANEAVVIEDQSSMNALSRSGALMTDNFGTAFVLGIVLFFIYAFAGGVSMAVPSMIAQTIMQVLVGAVLFTYAIALNVVFYFSCRCKLENFDLTMLAHSVGVDAPAVEVTPSAPASDSLPQ